MNSAMFYVSVALNLQITFLIAPGPNSEAMWLSVLRVSKLLAQHHIDPVTANLNEVSYRCQGNLRSFKLNVSQLGPQSGKWMESRPETLLF